MKRINIIINAILAAAVIALYVIYFMGIGTEKKDGTLTRQAQIGIDPISSIVYINIDSVLNNYDKYYDLQQKWQKKYKTSEAEFQNKQESLQKEVNDFQYKVQRGLITRSDAQQVEQQLYGQQQNLLQLQENLRLELAEQEQVMMRQVLVSIMEYLEEIKAIYGYQYVLGTNFGGNILYANDSLNITDDVVEGLNADYKAEREQTGK